MMKNNIEVRMPILKLINKLKIIPIVVLFTIVSVLGESYQLKDSSNTLNKVNIKNNINETIVNDNELIDIKEKNKDNNKGEESILAKTNNSDKTDNNNNNTTNTDNTDNTNKLNTFIKEVEKIDNNSIIEKTIKEELSIIYSNSSTINSNNSTIDFINKENTIKLSNTNNTNNVNVNNINNITETNKENKTGLITTITNILSNIHYTNEQNDNKKFIGEENININNTSNETMNNSNNKNNNNKNISLISIHDFQYQFREYVYCGSDNEVILAITEDNKLLRTANKGLTWGSVELPSEESGQFKKPDNNFLIFKIKVSPSEPETVVVFGYKGFSWISNNSGKNFTTFLFPIIDYIFHPFEKNWGLATTSGENRSQNLLITLDKGGSWKLIAQNVVQVGWGCLKQQQKPELKSVPKQRILMTFYPKSSFSHLTTKNWFLGWTYKIDFVYSDDFFQTTKVAVQKGNKFVLTPRYLFVAILLDEETQEIGLVVANSKDERYLFNEIMINIKTMSSRSYIFLDTAENSVFVHFNQFGTYSSFGNIYSSGGYGERYGLSLEYNVRNKDNQCDFETIQGLEGIYIANVFDKQYLESNFDDIRHEIMTMQDNVSQEDFKQGNFFYNNAWILKSLENRIETKITFNKGGSWHRLVPPSVGYNNRTINCFVNNNAYDGNYDNFSKDIKNDGGNSILNNQEAQSLSSECYLNLHGVSSSFPLVYSVKSAIGLIIANGNIGKYLSNDQEHVNTYLSRDAGFTWKEILPGPHIYEIGNKGGVIVFCEYNKFIDHFLYTLDEGNSFIKVYFKNSNIKIEIKNDNSDNSTTTPTTALKPKISNYQINSGDSNNKNINDVKNKETSKIEIKVINIITSPNNKNQQFLIFGKTRIGGITVHIDISKLNLPTCKETSLLFSSQTDYEKWIPSGAFNMFNPCLMGAKTDYYRKKQSSYCTISNSFESKSESHVCTCKAEDYECDIGFVRKGINCVKEHMHYDLEVDLFSPPLDCVDTYSVSKGYRKVPGNMCKGEEVSEFEPIIMYCPNNIFSLSGAVLLGLGALGILLLFVLAFSKRALNLFKRFCIGCKIVVINIKRSLGLSNTDSTLNNNNNVRFGNCGGSRDIGLTSKNSDIDRLSLYNRMGQQSVAESDLMQTANVYSFGNRNNTGNNNNYRNEFSGNSGEERTRLVNNNINNNIYID